MFKRVIEKINGLYGRLFPADGFSYYRHSAPVRVMHWLNVLFIIIMLMSGLNIFNAHPALYLGESSYSGRSPVFKTGTGENDKGEISGYLYLFGIKFNTTVLSGDSQKRAARFEFPSWITIPGHRWLAMARRWHFFFAWLLVLNGLTFVIYSAISRHLQKELVPTKQDLKTIGKSVIDHLHFKHAAGEESKNYNVLQKLAYLSVIFILVPMAILAGLGMSPAMNSLYPSWFSSIAGRQTVRTLHFIIAASLVLFVFIHIFEIIINGFRNNVHSMITGYFRVKQEKEK